ncbi:hypothetical protein [Pseudomonas typographi]|uniref:hypothetical protein n=1 Tax=Pseudomonas typographi TaxID=2715964 RepID=UPI0016883592|nr:hypothetical protein [Pseudomonas typographi]MBD1550014.1 hypothetical protein [Pseudomonas typographi]MBD1585396.1 hypothetical protein [Pseudomonas typographi]
MTAAHKPFALPPLELPQRCRAGIGAEAASQLCLRVGRDALLEPGDLVEVFIDDRFATALIVKPEHLGRPLVFQVRNAVQQSGRVRLRYEVLRAGHYSAHSPVTLLLAKLEYPGGAPLREGEEENQFLPPICFPRALSVRQARQHGGLPFYLPAYPNMAAGDEITVRWGDERFDLPPLLPRQVGQPVQGTIPLAALRQVRPGRWQDVTWSAVDRVGNHSRWAPCQALELPTDEEVDSGGEPTRA